MATAEDHEGFIAAIDDLPGVTPEELAFLHPQSVSLYIFFAVLSFVLVASNLTMYVSMLFSRVLLVTFIIGRFNPPHTLQARSSKLGCRVVEKRRRRQYSQ